MRSVGDRLFALGFYLDPTLARVQVDMRDAPVPPDPSSFNYRSCLLRPNEVHGFQHWWLLTRHQILRTGRGTTS